MKNQYLLSEKNRKIETDLLTITLFGSQSLEDEIRIILMNFDNNLCDEFQIETDYDKGITKSGLAWVMLKHANIQAISHDVKLSALQVLANKIKVAYRKYHVSCDYLIKTWLDIDELGNRCHATIGKDSLVYARKSKELVISSGNFYVSLYDVKTSQIEKVHKFFSVNPLLSLGMCENSGYHSDDGHLPQVPVFTNDNKCELLIIRIKKQFFEVNFETLMIYDGSRSLHLFSHEFKRMAEIDNAYDFVLKLINAML